MNVNERITEIRKERGITQEDLADKLGINRSVLNRIEKGTRPVRDEELVRIADYFDVTTDYLFGRKIGATAPVTPDEESLLGLYRRMTKESKQYLAGFLMTMMPVVSAGQLAQAR